MTITFTGALEYEATLGVRVDTAGYFDPNYAPYALKPLPYDNAHVYMTFSPILLDTPTYENWFHFKLYRTGTVDSAALESYFFFVYGVGNVPLFSIRRGQNSSRLYLHVYNAAGSSSVNVEMTGLMPAGLLIAYDFRLIQNGVNHILEMYIDGIVQRTISIANVAYVEPISMQISNIGRDDDTYGEFHLSEIIMTDTEPTLASRLATMVPIGAPEVNTFSGTWEALGDEDTGSGISTDVAGSRIAGGFSAYNGTLSPIGVRALVQSIRYVDNLSGLSVRGFLRNSTNIDTFTNEQLDESRVLTVWDINPFTAADWEVADLSTVLGGVRSLVPS